MPSRKKRMIINEKGWEVIRYKRFKRRRTFFHVSLSMDRLCGLVVRVPGYRS
jgi:hypothetical protein